MSFSPINVGEKSVQMMRVSRTDVATAFATGDFKQTNDCGTSNSDTCTIYITFSPSSQGFRGGLLLLEDRNFVPRQIIGLSGVAIGPPHLVLSSQILTFESQDVMTTSTKQQLTLANDGGSRLYLGPIIATAEFHKENDCPAFLDAGSSCSVFLTFTPLGTGLRSGVLAIDDSSGLLLRVVGLTGVGSGVPKLVVSTDTIQFQSQRLSGVSATKSINITNTGTTTLNGMEISVSGDFLENDTCGRALPASSSCVISVSFKPSNVGLCSGTIHVTGDALTPVEVALNGEGTPNTDITAVWANEGGDKVTRDELRATQHTENLTGTVLNKSWDGTKIVLTSARNEVVSFNLVLEAATSTAQNVHVTFDTLTSQDGLTISSTPASGNAIFNWVNRPIELFYVRYLQIKGLSYFGYVKDDERQVPVRFQRKWQGDGQATGSWIDRPDHDKFYPDIMVPLELVPTFSIQQGQNQSIWADVYVPKGTTPGTYTGMVVIQENGRTTHEVPVQLTVHAFTLPETPTSKTMVNLDPTDIMWRYVTGYGGYVNWASPEGARIAKITDKYYELFHRHKIALIGENECPPNDRPCDTTLPRLNGSLYTSLNGYDGPGKATPEGVFSIGTYGTWGAGSYGVPFWKYDKNLFWNHIDNYASWFHANSPTTDYFLYLEDEPPSSDFSQVEMWSQWIQEDPGPGKDMYSLATINAVAAQTHIPSLQIPVTPAGIGACPNSPPCDPAESMQAAADIYRQDPRRKFWGYNDGRPGTGTAVTEDDGVAMRTIPWAQYKMGIDRWFYWYANLNSPVNWFQNAVTWGSVSTYDWSLGETGTDGTSNGNGLLVYPGTDVQNPSDSYGVDGPFASLRIKEWRRGIQDVDYLSLAVGIDSAATKGIVNEALPRALWENIAPGGDPSYFKGSISWSSNPDDWENERAKLTVLIDAFCAVNPTHKTCRGE